MDDPDLGAGIRAIAAEDGYIYASFYGGARGKINANTLEVVEKKLVTGIGYNLEGVAICEDMLYVANSYSRLTGTGFTNDVNVVDLRYFKLKEMLAVVNKPNVLIEEDDKVFLISWGNSFVGCWLFLQMIDPAANNKVTELGSATRMCAANDILYLVNSLTDWNTESYYNVNHFFTYNIKTKH